MVYLGILLITFGYLVFLGGVALIWLMWNFLVWQRLLRKGVLVEGRIEAHRADIVDTNRGKQTVYSLEYSFDCNETNYLQSQTMSPLTYRRFKDGDRVKVWLFPEHPTSARIEETSAFMTLMRKYGGKMLPKRD